MLYKGKMEVEKEKGQELEKFCHVPPKDCGRGEAIFDQEFVFPNGMRMAIQVITSEEPDTETCWTQGVLFDKDGNELGCTDVGETFLGEYQIMDTETKEEYLVEVVLK